MPTRHRLFLVSCLFALAALARPSADVGPTYAIRNARIVTVSGAVVEKGTIVLRNGLIESLGPAEKAAIPEDAEVIEAEGLTAYPGLISAHTNLFLEEPAAAGAARGALGQTTAPPFDPKDALEPWPYRLLKPRKTTLDSFLKAGFTTVLVAPNRGIFQGQSVVVNLNGENPEPMVIKPSAGLHINLTTNRGGGYPSSLMGTIAHIRQSLMDAGYYANAQAVYMKNQKGMKRPAFDPFLEALVPYVRDKKPVIIQCNNAEDIKRALLIADEFKLKAMLSHANEAWRDAAVLKKAAVPLLVTLDFRPPTSSMYVSQGEDLRKKAEAEIYPANAAALAKDGIAFALTTLGLSDGSAALRNIQIAIKSGLPKDVALKALTLQPAEYLGLSAQLGSLEPGKIANVLLTKGELFDEKTQVEKVFVDGVLWKF